MVDTERSELEASRSIPKSGTLQGWTGSGTLWAGVAAALSVAVYANVLSGPFVYDDFREVSDNPSIGNLGDLGTIFRYYPTRPITNLSYAIDFAVGGLNPSTFHVTNVLLHAANVILLFLLALRLLREDSLKESARARAAMFGAFAAACLFAVHPMMTGAVAYISARAEVLSTTFFLASFYCFRRGFAAGDWKAGTIGAALLVLAIGSKETAVVMPGILLAFDVVVVGRTDPSWRRRLFRFHLPVFVTVLVFASVRLWWYVSAEVPADAGVHWHHVPVGLHVIERYLVSMFVPVGLSILPGVAWIDSLMNPRLLTTAAVLGATILLAVAVRRRAPVVTFGAAWFFLTLLPPFVLFVIADRGGPMAEHRVYLASVGFFMAVGSAASAAVRDQPERRRLASLTLGALIVLCLSLTISRNRLWSDPVLLWQDAIQKAPNMWMVHIQLGYEHQRIGDHVAAVGAFEAANRLLPSEPVGYLELARSLGELGRHDDARRVLRTAVQRFPADPRPRVALAHIQGGHFGDLAAAARLCAEAHAIAPDHQGAISCVARYGRSPADERW